MTRGDLPDPAGQGLSITESWIPISHGLSDVYSLKPVRSKSDKAEPSSVDGVMPASIVPDRIMWYKARARMTRARSQFLRVLEVLLATAIPVIGVVFSGNMSSSWSWTLVAGIGALLVVTVAIQSILFRPAEPIRLEMVADRLEAEYRLYLAESERYSGLDRSDRARLLISVSNRIEGDFTAPWLADR